jgi:predicted phage terminase large subunit-like protein
MPEKYAQEYLNYPMADESAFFRRDDFLEMTDEQKKMPMRYYAAGDLAVSKQNRRSYTALIVGGVDQDGMLNIVKVVRRRIESDEILEELLALQIRYGPEIWALEKGQISNSIGPFLQAEQMKRGIFLNIDDKVPAKDKMARARSIQGRMRQGGVRFDKDAEWWPAFYEELLRFDKGEYDDQVDAFAWLGLLLNEVVSSETNEELEDIRWEQEKIRYEREDEGGGGMSEITGY